MFSKSVSILKQCSDAKAEVLDMLVMVSKSERKKIGVEVQRYASSRILEKKHKLCSYKSWGQVAG